MVFIMNTFMSNSEGIEFTELYLKYKKLVFHIAFELLNNQYDAEDATSETFIRVAKYYKKIRCISVAEQKYYISAIAKNVSIDTYNKLQKIHTNSVSIQDDENISDTINYDDIIMDNINKDMLYSAIDSLPEKQRTVFLFKYNYGFTVKEIAKMLNEKNNTIKVNLYRAKVKLAELLRGDYNVE